jgi:hypothetical protein
MSDPDLMPQPSGPEPLRQEPPPVGQVSVGSVRRPSKRHKARRGPGTPRRLLARRVVAFLLAAFLTAYLALKGAGYDLVIRQQFFLIVWGLVAVGFAFGGLPRGYPDRAVAIPLAGLVGLVLWTALSFAWTDSDERTMAELARIVGYAGIVVLAFGGLNRHTFRAAAAGFSVAAAGICAFALATRLFPDSLPQSDVAQIFRPDRLSYPLDYWNAVGTWGAMSIAIGLAWSAHADRTWVRALALASVPVAGTTIYLTYSRGSVIGVAVAVLAVLVLSRNRFTLAANGLAAAAATALTIGVIRDRPEIADATGGAGGGMVLVVLTVLALGCAGFAMTTWSVNMDRLRMSNTAARVVAPAAVVVFLTVAVAAGHGVASRAWHQFTHQTTVGAQGDPSARLTSAAGSRHDVWESAIDWFESAPMEGTGPGTFEFDWSRDGKSIEFVRDAHSLYLETLAEAGLPALVLLLAFLGGLLFVAIRARPLLGRSGDFAASVAMCGAFIVFLVAAGVDWMWEETAVTALALGGIAAAAAGGSVRLSRSQRRIGGTGWRVALVGVSVIACAIQVPGIVGNQRSRAAEQSIAAGDLGEAAALAGEAHDAEPWAATPWAQLAIVREREGRYEEAADDARKAIDKEPTNWRHPLLLAEIEAKLGDHKAAVRAFRRGERLRPRSPLFAPSSPIGRLVLRTRS